MSLRDKIWKPENVDERLRLYEKYGVVANPFPSSSQTSDNPHHALGDADELAEMQIAAFIRDGKSQAVVVEGTQGVGKTNFLNHFESEIRAVCGGFSDYYVVRYLADPETTFDGTIRRLFEALGPDHLHKLADKLRNDNSHVRNARSQDVQTAAFNLLGADSNTDKTIKLMMDWLLGLRVLKPHREQLGVQFRLDTVESKTAALRDIVEISRSVGILRGIFLLLDELEKQDGVLGPRAVVRYLSAIRAIIDALPNGLFLMIAVTPDALRRYAATLPALRGRLQNRIELSPLKNIDHADKLARFYVDSARATAKRSWPGDGGELDILTPAQVKECYEKLKISAEPRGDEGVRQREFLHELHMLAENVISTA